jgi:hypothetical protein
MLVPIGTSISIPSGSNLTFGMSSSSFFDLDWLLD